MKRLYLVRHAKSDWIDASLPDIERPLNDRGRVDAPKMAKTLVSKSYIPDLIITSPAVRAKTTADYFIAAYQNVPSELDSKLYHADIDDIINTCIHIDDKNNSIMIFCHNPGITYFANVICDANIDNVPTTGVLVIDVDTPTWENLDMSKLTLIDFLYPKMK
jgi:phosphohistidine phosphatase